jgi:hypothetical protein
MVKETDKLLTLILILNLCLKQICSTEMKNLLEFTIYFLKSHRQPQCTLQLVCEDRVLFV